MSELQQGMYQVDFENLIKILGENLYSHPKVVIRELLQNASDSCVRRLAQEKNYEPSIYVTADYHNRQLIIEDNGVGMAHEEVVRYLASIGSGLTREERKRLMINDQENAQLLIGQFGIGFLSAFVVSRRVIVETRSINLNEAIYWECEGTTAYQIGRGQRTEPGTKVTLFLKPVHYDLLETRTLKETIIRYADLIAFPIYVNREPMPVNRMHAPWHSDATEAEYAQYVQHRYNVLPLALKIVKVESLGLQVRGVLFIAPRTVEPVHKSGVVDLFQKRIYVNEDSNLLPAWAGFISGVLDCPTLDLVASRESVASNRASYKALQDFLTQCVAAFMQQLARHERSTFLEIVHQYEWTVMAGAIHSEFFFNQVKDLIPFPSDTEPLTLPKYLERVPARLGGLKTIYYVPAKQLMGQQQSSLFKARGVPVLQVDPIAEQFLKKYAQSTENIHVRSIDSGVVELMEYADDIRWHALEAHYQNLGISAKGARFSPPDMPAMAVRRADYDQEQIIEQLIEGSRAVLDLMGHIGKERSDAYGICFNVDNPIIQRLAEYQGDQTILRAALKAIYSSALLAAGVELTSEMNQEVSQAQIHIIELLLERS